MTVYEPSAAGEQTISNVVATPQRVRTKPERGTTAWALQRLSAYGLVVCLAVHMWFNHFANISTGNRITFELVSRRFELYPLMYAINDITLLTFALFHGLNGVRNVIYDWSTSNPVRRVSTIVLVIVGIVFLIDGAFTLLALMQLPTTR